MTIDIKYQTGQQVWFMYNNNICCGVVEQCSVTVLNNTAHIVYVIVTGTQQCQTTLKLLDTEIEATCEEVADCLVKKSFKNHGKLILK